MKKDQRRIRQNGRRRKSEVRIRNKMGMTPLRVLKTNYLTKTNKAPTKTNKSDGPTPPMSKR
jgi:hypothetical protein